MRITLASAADVLAPLLVRSGHGRNRLNSREHSRPVLPPKMQRRFVIVTPRAAPPNSRERLSLHAPMARQIVVRDHCRHSLLVPLCQGDIRPCDGVISPKTGKPRSPGPQWHAATFFPWACHPIRQAERGPRLRPFLAEQQSRLLPSSAGAAGEGAAAAKRLRRQGSPSRPRWSRAP